MSSRVLQTTNDDSVTRLAVTLGATWPSIDTARKDARVQIALLRNAMASLKPPSNTSVVAFGSLAREEWTQGSDVDWTLMIDGPSDMAHFDVAKAIADKLEELGFRKPGPTAIFGTMASSHPLVHHIGGEEDTNQNTTRRILLLLESVWLSDNVTQERVIRSILERYVVGDPPSTNTRKFHVPLFLLNDVIRYWRTMAVDYATKKWQRSNDGWALRNIKLRMSRKLLYAKGLLACLLCDEQFGGLHTDESIVEHDLLSRCFALTRVSAIDMIADAALKVGAIDAGKRILESYDAFLSMLADATQRETLEKLEFGNSCDSLFNDQRANSKGTFKHQTRHGGVGRIVGALREECDSRVAFGDDR